MLPKFELIDNAQNDILSKLQELDGKVEDIEERGQDKSSHRGGGKVDPKLEQRLNSKLDSQYNTLESKIKNLNTRVDELSNKVRK